MLRHLPNSLTIARLLLALPLGLYILREDYWMALVVGALAGLTDALDGFLARRLNALSRIGAALDPIADKALITSAFIAFAAGGLVPWYLALAVILRDLVIIAGAAAYYRLIGPFEFAVSRLSKANMFIQICFCVLVLAVQVVPDIPSVTVLAGSTAVLFLAAASGFDYVFTWSIKAVQAHRDRDPTRG